MANKLEFKNLKLTGVPGGEIFNLVETKSYNSLSKIKTIELIDWNRNLNGDAVFLYPSDNTKGSDRLYFNTDASNLKQDYPFEQKSIFKNFTVLVYNVGSEYHEFVFEITFYNINPFSALLNNILGAVSQLYYFIIKFFSGGNNP